MAVHQPIEMNGDLARQREGCLLWDSEPLIEARDLQIGVLWIILALQSSPIGPGDGVDELLRRGAEHSFDHKAVVPCKQSSSSFAKSYLLILATSTAR